MKDFLRRSYNRIRDDRGSTLITAIVAIAFVTILTSIILGTTVVNVRMKGIDKRTKNDFYYAERSLNDIYTGLGQELSLYAADEYEKAFKKVGEVELSGEDFNLAETGEKAFRKNFIGKAFDFASGLDVAKLQAYVLDESKGTVLKIGSVQCQKKNGDSCTKTDPAAYRVVLKDVEVYVEDSTGFRSTISTDIVINIPTVDFLGTNADVSDYGLIANEGLYIVGGTGGCEITGNVYAGVHADSRSLDTPFKERTDEYSRSPVYGGINIRDGKATFDGNYIISKGDINLSGTNPQIKVNSPAAGADVNLANLWFTSIRTITNRPGGEGATITNDPVSNPTIDVNANIFALNDMTLNADNSSAVIKGNYYGYNEGGLSNILQKKTGRFDGENSAIIVNGSKAYLDMRQINNFVLMGKAYIDFTSDTATDASGTATQVVPTAESVALKTNQQLYLVPPDFLDGPNPAEDTAESHPFNINILPADLATWFGYDYLDTSVQPDATKAPTSMHQSYKVKLVSGGSNAFYDYLVFNDGINWKPPLNPETGYVSDIDAKEAADKNVKYIVKKHTDGTLKVFKYTKSTDALGTQGSISSKAMFFLKIMMAKNAYQYEYDHDHTGFSSLADFIEEKEKSKMQPSSYRLRDRISQSMGYEYFDLGQCIVGDTAHASDAHYYARNAVVNYEKVADPEHAGSQIIQSNVLDNTDGMLRYSGYTENLFKRYMLLCTKLDGKEDILLETDPASGKSVNAADWPEWTVSYATPQTAAPICHFVMVNNLGTMNISDSINSAGAEGLKPGAFGVCIAQSGDLNLGSVPAAALTSGTFKGIAIVKGNITVPANMNVDGLLMATGTITLLGNNKIHYDKGLIQSRIEKEMNIVKNKDAGVSDPYKNYYVINYLSKDNGVGVPELIYQVEAGSKIKRDRIEADYNDFVHYENWQKGEK